MHVHNAKRTQMFSQAKNRRQNLDKNQDEDKLMQVPIHTGVSKKSLAYSFCSSVFLMFKCCF